jgi:prepilin-type N-terminal cleavage/methylation domain-containing protein
MIGHHPRKVGSRGGFTLLEVLLASAIGVMLLAGLYVAVDVQLHQMHLARRTGELSVLADQLLSKIARDLSGQLAPVLPAATASSSTAGGSTSSSGSSTSGTSGSGSTSGSTGTSSGGASSSSTATTGTVITFNNGILGDNADLIITSSRVPQENLKPEVLNTGNQIYGTSDVSRVMYWMAGGDAGLARFELKTVTDPNQLAYCALPPAVPDETSYIIAPEVKSIQFQYFDGANWNDSWDGSQPSQLTNSDGVTPQGPPVAIAIVIGIQTDSPEQPKTTAADTALGGGAGMKMYRRVIAIPTTNGITITPATAPGGQ